MSPICPGPRRGPVARFRVSRRGVSEVVGSLMLVLIVVGAATALSVFVASYQKQLQAQQALSQQRGLETLKVLRVTPTLNANGTAWSLLNFTVASLYINPATVTELSINNNPVKQYTAWKLNLSTGSFGAITVAAGGQLALGAREQLNVIVNLTPGPNYSFYASSFVLHTTDFVKVEVFTALENDFGRIFIPPTAIGIVTTIQSWNGTAFVPVTVLDASGSFQPPGNSTIVAWTWKITPDGTSYSGEKAVAQFNRLFVTHNVTLAVTNSDGLISTDTFHYP